MFGSWQQISLGASNAAFFPPMDPYQQQVYQWYHHHHHHHAQVPWPNVSFPAFATATTADLHPPPPGGGGSSSSIPPGQIAAPPPPLPCNPAPPNPPAPPVEEKPPLPPEPPPEDDVKEKDLKARNPEEQQRLDDLKQQAQQWQQHQQFVQQSWLQYSQHAQTATAPLPGQSQEPPPPPPASQQMSICSDPSAADVLKSENTNAALESIKKEELEFNKQYTQWKRQYDDWREQNKNHPNRDQFIQYEHQWHQYEAQMEEKRRDIYKRKCEILHSSRTSNSDGRELGGNQKGPGLNQNMSQGYFSSLPSDDPKLQLHGEHCKNEQYQMLGRPHLSVTPNFSPRFKGPGAGDSSDISKTLAVGMATLADQKGLQSALSSQNTPVGPLMSIDLNKTQLSSPEETSSSFNKDHKKNEEPRDQQSLMHHQNLSDSRYGGPAAIHMQHGERFVHSGHRFDGSKSRFDSSRMQLLQGQASGARGPRMDGPRFEGQQNQQSHFLGLQGQQSHFQRSQDQQSHLEEQQGQQSDFENLHGYHPAFEGPHSQQQQQQQRFPGPQGQQQRFQTSQRFQVPQVQQQRFQGPRAQQQRFPSSQGQCPRFDGLLGQRPKFDGSQGQRLRFDGQQGQCPRFMGLQGQRPRFDAPQGQHPRFENTQNQQVRFDGPPQGLRPRFDSSQGQHTRFDGLQGQRPSLLGQRPRFDGSHGQRLSLLGQGPRFPSPQGQSSRFDNEQDQHSKFEEQRKQESRFTHQAFPSQRGEAANEWQSQNSVTHATKQETASPKPSDGSTDGPPKLLHATEKPKPHEPSKPQTQKQENSENQKVCEKESEKEKPNVKHQSTKDEKNQDNKDDFPQKAGDGCEERVQSSETNECDKSADFLSSQQPLLSTPGLQQRMPMHYSGPAEAYGQKGRGSMEGPRFGARGGQQRFNSRAGGPRMPGPRGMNPVFRPPPANFRGGSLRRSSPGMGLRSRASGSAQMGRGMRPYNRNVPPPNTDEFFQGDSVPQSMPSPSSPARQQGRLPLFPVVPRQSPQHDERDSEVPMPESCVQDTGRQGEYDNASSSWGRYPEGASDLEEYGGNNRYSYPMGRVPQDSFDMPLDYDRWIPDYDRWSRAYPDSDRRKFDYPDDRSDRYGYPRDYPDDRLDQYYDRRLPPYDRDIHDDPYRLLVNYDMHRYDYYSDPYRYERDRDWYRERYPFTERDRYSISPRDREASLPVTESIDYGHKSAPKEVFDYSSGYRGYDYPLPPSPPFGGFVGAPQKIIDYGHGKLSTVDKDGYDSKDLIKDDKENKENDMDKEKIKYQITDRDHDRERERSRDREREWDRERERREREKMRERNYDKGRERYQEDERWAERKHEERKYDRDNRGRDTYSKLRPETKIETMSAEDLLCKPGRNNRPPQIVIFLRGLPGSGKTYVSKLIRDKETGYGGPAPRMLCLDDYFMVEVEKIEKDPELGKMVKRKVLQYEYEPELEEAYRQSILKSFKKTIDDGFFPFIIYDAVNEKVKHFQEFWSYAKSKGFQVYVATVHADVATCAKRNIHSRTNQDIQKIMKRWEETPKHYIHLDIRPLLQDAAITQVEMEDSTSEEKSDANKDKEEEEEEEMAEVYQKSRWEIEASGEQLDKLDGIRLGKRKRPPSPQSLDDYLQIEDLFDTRKAEPGKKRIRWADIEERKEQLKRRELGFVVGQTQRDWERITDDSYAEKALNRTKYI